MHRNYRKALVIATPKQGLKLPAAVSPIEEMGPGTSFKPIISENFGTNATPSHVVLCSGRLYFDISAKLKEQNKKSIKVIRVEELAPFPSELIEQEISSLSKDTKVTWFQEEPMNQGAYQFAKMHIDKILEV